MYQDMGLISAALQENKSVIELKLSGNKIKTQGEHVDIE
jgi:hypothetical protein